MKSYRALFVVSLMVPALLAAPKKGSQAQQNSGDRIEVIGHMALAEGPAVNLLTAVHWGKNYLYIEHGGEGAVTVVDVTDPRSPKTAGEFVPPAGSGPVHLNAVEGSAALFVAAPAVTAPRPSNILIVSFVDQAHPQVVRQFSGVRCTLRDAGRHITYLAGDDGLWVVQSISAQDRDEMERYTHELLYNH